MNIIHNLVLNNGTLVAFIHLNVIQMCNKLIVNACIYILTKKYAFDVIKFVIISGYFSTNGFVITVVYTNFSFTFCKPIILKTNHMHKYARIHIYIHIYVCISVDKKGCINKKKINKRNTKSNNETNKNLL